MSRLALKYEGGQAVQMKQYIPYVNCSSTVKDAQGLIIQFFLGFYMLKTFHNTEFKF